MLFNSIHFLVFFPIVVGLYFATKQKYRWILLLLASYYFYMSWKPEYAILIMIATLVSYVSALGMEKVSDSLRKFFLIISLIVNLGLLFVFKYFNFVSDAIVDFLNLFSLQLDSPTLQVLLPVGISFYTFQTLSYVIDVYKKKITPEKHFGIYAVYVSFFPQLVAGPIERAGNLLPQFFVKHQFEYARVVDGLRLMLWGFFKKVIIADGLALFVDRIYGDVSTGSGVSFVLATIFFSFQIFCDFSGYTDIAIGAAKVMGYELMDNFRAPYLAKSIPEFWRRWHISLSSWFQDYLFTPLYYNFGKLKFLHKFNSKSKHLLAFTASTIIGLSLLGLWHGANWTFLFFGLYHGFFIVLYYLTRQHWDALYASVRIALTFVISTFGWIFFRAGTLTDAWYIIKNLFTTTSYGFWHDFRGFFLHNEYEFAILMLPIVIVTLTHFFEKEHESLLNYFSSRSVFFRWLVYFLLVMMIMMFGSFGSREFIYFNF